MLAASLERIVREVSEAHQVLDVGGWAKPLARADWVIDLMPYETRGLYGREGEGDERFTRETWLVADICDRAPWPFANNQFDFAVCSHTLEDVRDPIWVCSELIRVARAGYVEVPSRLEEQCWGVHGPWAGWSHHRWLIDQAGGALEFVLKPGVLHGRAEFQFPAGIARALTASERVEALFWQGSFGFRELMFFDSEELHAYLAAPVAERLPALAARRPARSGMERLTKWAKSLTTRGRE